MVLFSSLAMYISHKYHIHYHIHIIYISYTYHIHIIYISYTYHIHIIYISYPKNTKKNLQDINEENNMFVV